MYRSRCGSENRADHRDETTVDRERHPVPEDGQCSPEHLVLHLIVEVPESLVVEARLPVHHQRDEDRQQRVLQEGECAHIDAVLRPALRSSVDRVHLERAQPGPEEEDAEHRPHRHGVCGLITHLLELRGLLSRELRVRAGELGEEVDSHEPNRHPRRYDSLLLRVSAL